MEVILDGRQTGHLGSNSLDITPANILGLGVGDWRMDGSQPIAYRKPCSVEAAFIYDRGNTLNASCHINILLFQSCFILGCYFLEINEMQFLPAGFLHIIQTMAFDTRPFGGQISLFFPHNICQ